MINTRCICLHSESVHMQSYVCVCVCVCVWEREREVLWPRSSHLTSRHLCLPQLYQHIPALPMQTSRQAGSGPAVCQEPGFSPSHQDWLGVCVHMGGGDRGWKGDLYPLPQLHSMEFKLFLSTPVTSPLLATMPWVNKQPGSGAKQSAPLGCS